METPFADQLLIFADCQIFLPARVSRRLSSSSSLRTRQCHASPRKRDGDRVLLLHKKEIGNAAAIDGPIKRCPSEIQGPPTLSPLVSGSTTGLLNIIRSIVYTSNTNVAS